MDDNHNDADDHNESCSSLPTKSLWTTTRDGEDRFADAEGTNQRSGGLENPENKDILVIDFR